jgi:hypothetical protein
MPVFGATPEAGPARADCSTSGDAAIDLFNLRNNRAQPFRLRAV